MAILICEDKVRLVFFPFTTEGIPCVDAIVSEAIDLLAASLDAELTRRLNEDWFSFVCYYLKVLFVDKMTFLDPRVFNLIANQKKTLYATRKNATRGRLLQSQLS